MAERKPGTDPQVTDDDFVDDMIRDLKVVGRLGVLDVSDKIVPIYLLGQRTAFKLSVQQPSYNVAEIFSGGLLLNPGAGTVIADTTALAIGTYDFIVDLTTVAANVSMEIQWRDTANVADINNWTIRLANAGMTAYRWTMAISVLPLERLRVVNTAAPGAGISIQASIAATLRQ